MNIFTDNGMIRHHECDAAGKVKLPVLLDYFQDAAAQHADILQVGMNDISGGGFIWVLSRLKLQIDTMPALGDRVEVITYPAGFSRIFANRQYLMRCNGTDAVRGTSEWLLINPVTGRPANPAKSLPATLPKNEDMPRWFTDLDKLNCSGGTPCGAYTVGMGDVDLNRHLNNAVYSRWLIDALGNLRPGTIPLIKSVQINFLREGVPGHRIELFGLWQDDGSFSLCGVWQESGETAFQAEGNAAISPFETF